MGERAKKQKPDSRWKACQVCNVQFYGQSDICADCQGHN